MLANSPNSGEFSYEPMPTACGIYERVTVANFNLTWLTDGKGGRHHEL
jgi:hypothetical protein